MRRSAAFVFLGALCGSLTVDAADTVPVLQAESLTGKSVVLPADLPALPTALVIGFSKASRADTEAWSKRLEAALPRGQFTIYSVSVIEDVPRLMRRFVLSSIRSSVPERLHERFLLVTKQSTQWRALAGDDGTDTAFVVLVDRQSEIVWRVQGPASEQAVRTLVERATSLTDGQSPPALQQ